MGAFGAFLRGFAYAGRGLARCMRERNFRFHLCAAGFTAYFAARFYELSRAEWAVLLLTFAAVISLEAVNTAIECLCDKVSPEKDPLIMRAKDCAAGAVLAAAVFSVGIAAALFWDTSRFAEIWEYYSQRPMSAVLLAAALAAAWCAVFLPKKK